jgi:glycosyltransferase involved in cell wall biosynthesis
MRLLFLNYEYPPLGGGAANATAYLAEEFSRYDDVCVDIVTASIDGRYHTESIGDRVTVHRLPIGKNAKNLHFQSMRDLLVYAWKSYMFARKRMRTTRYDVMQAFFTVPCGVVAQALSHEFDVPYIVSLRGSDVPGYSDRFRWLYPFLRPIVRCVWRQASRVVSNSRGLRELALQTSPKQKIDIIPNGVDTQRFVPASAKSESASVPSKTRDAGMLRLTLGASRITDRKGIKYLIEAMDALKTDIPFVLTVIGEGNAKARLERMVKDRGLTSRIDFAGRVPREETLAYYREADIFVLPSLNEGMSNAMLEALACGLPVITTRTGGAAELVREGVNGFLVKQGDADDLARALRTLAQDAALRKRMGAKSRLVAESMSWASVATRSVRMYRETLKNPLL